MFRINNQYLEVINEGEGVFSQYVLKSKIPYFEIENSEKKALEKLKKERTSETTHIITDGWGSVRSESVYDKYQTNKEVYVKSLFFSRYLFREGLNIFEEDESISNSIQSYVTREMTLSNVRNINKGESVGITQRGAILYHGVSIEYGKISDILLTLGAPKDIFIKN